jgi:Ca2+-binding RTX toxin-like protein
MTRLLGSVGFIGLMALVILGVSSALAAGNSVPPSGVDDLSNPIGLNDLKPPECSGIAVTNLITGSGNLGGTPGNDLILGSPGSDRINGGPGDDCLVGGGGNDDLSGKPDNDVCIGGPGADTADDSCEAVFEVP